MKSERRHELKTNTLAQGLEGLPAFWHRYGSKVLLGVVAVLALILFFRFQARNARETQDRAGEAYAAAIGGIASLESTLNIRDGRVALDQRRQIQDQVERALQQVIDESKDGAHKAEAIVARGNLNWRLAMMPAIRGSDTQPSLKSAEGKDELLDKARKAYDEAIAADGAKPLTVVSARLGLAAIAEERGKWDEAKAAYEQIVNDPSAPETFKGEARLKLDDLDKLRTPALIGKPATEPSPAGPLGPELPSVPTTGATTTSTTTTAPTTSTAPTTTPAQQ